MKKIILLLLIPYFVLSQSDQTCSDEIDLGEDINLCSNEIATLNAGDGFSKYVWSTGDTSKSIDVYDEGAYIVNAYLYDSSKVIDYVNLDGENDFINIFDTQSGNGILNNINAGILQVRIKILEPFTHGNVFFYGSEDDNMRGLELRISSDLKPFWAFHPGPVDPFEVLFSSKPLEFNNWYFITATWDQNGMKLYIENELVGQNSIVPDMGNLSSKVRLGRMGSDNSTFSKISYDFLKLYKGSDFDGNICEEPNNELLAYYEFEEGDNINLNDLSGNNRNGKYLNINSWENEEIVTNCNSDYCVSSDTINVSIQETPPPQGQSLQFINCGNNISSLEVIGQNIKWYLESGELVSSLFELEDGQSYYASQTINDCESVEKLKINVEFIFDQNLVELPNHFTPNSDGFSDFFELNYDNFKNCNLFSTEFNIRVYDRYYRLVYEGESESNILWDGNNNKGDILPTDTYYYEITPVFKGEKQKEIIGKLFLER